LVTRVVRRARTLAQDFEITLEANPGTVSLDTLQGYRAAGVNRLSLGAQAAQPELLRQLNRTHSPQDIAQAVHWARRAGFENVSLDAIYGLPTQTLDQWQHTVRFLVSLRPTHLSLYHLIVEPGTALARSLHSGQLSLPDDDRVADMADWAASWLSEQGFEQYELSNYARVGFESRHNSLYWQLEPYVAVGAGAHAYRPGRRWWNVSQVREYIRRALAGDSVSAGEETLEAVEEMRQFIWLGLRRRAGISRATFYQRFGADPIAVFQSTWQQLQSQALVAIGTDRVTLTARGWDLANWVFRAFVDAPCEGIAGAPAETR
jgi:oxygen-independent coproporphyrinogen-3 oxidase